MKAPLRFDVAAGVVEAAARTGGQAELDLDGPGLAPARQLEHQVDLGAGLGAKEARRRTGGHRGQQVLDHEPFPAGAGHGMAGEGVVVFDAEQGVDQTAVPDVDLGRLDQPLADVGVEGPQPPHQQQVDQQIDVPRHRRTAHPQAGGQPGGVQEPALAVGEHRPQSLQGLGRQPPLGELGDVALQVGADEIAAEGEAVGIAGRQEAVGKPAAHPERRHRRRRGGDVEHVERVERHVLDASGQALPRLPEQVHGCGPQDQEAPRAPACPPAPVDQASQLLKQLGRAVDLVENDEAILVLGEEQVRIGELGPVGAGLQVEVEGLHLLRDRVGQGGLADLPRPDQGNRRLALQGGSGQLICSASNHLSLTI